jgi:hypothetical protein
VLERQIRSMQAAQPNKSGTESESESDTVRNSHLLEVADSVGGTSWIE